MRQHNTKTSGAMKMHIQAKESPSHPGWGFQASTCTGGVLHSLEVVLLEGHEESKDRENEWKSTMEITKGDRWPQVNQ